ncbi:hypothetical protein TSUD_204080 [Trifolium subterraneum]|uniref:Glutathione transferase n=1 Tax=Trifolium subterraneum TaxID=3900 RepID=A0A2Z6MF08_TRISU|nr:hypothetical protein TSUD_204080 [Trifolium subterraneum]
MATANVVVGAGGEAEEHNNNNKLLLYSFWRSSCSFRVRIALNIKGLKYDYKPVNLLKEEQSHPEFLQLNPVGFVPVLVDGPVDKHPQHPLLPTDIHKRAINFQTYIEGKAGPDEKLSWVQSVIKKGFTALEKLLKEHTGKYATGDEVSMADIFLAPQIHSAFKKFNIDMVVFYGLLYILCGGIRRCNETYGLYCCGAITTAALVMDSEFPTLSRLHETYYEIPAFRKALPENQPDAAG